MKLFKDDYEDMENEEYIPDDVPKTKKKNSYMDIPGQPGYMGEIYLGDGMVMLPNGKITEQS